VNGGQQRGLRRRMGDLDPTDRVLDLDNPAIEAVGDRLNIRYCAGAEKSGDRLPIVGRTVRKQQRDRRLPCRDCQAFAAAQLARRAVVEPLECLIEAADAAKAARHCDFRQRQLRLMNELLGQKHTARLCHRNRCGSKMGFEQAAQLATAHAEAGGQGLDPASIERSVLDQCERSRHGCRGTAPGPEVGRAFGTAAQAQAKAGFLSGRGRRHEKAILEFRVPSGANRAAVDAGGLHACEKPPIVTRITREHGPVTGGGIEMHGSNIGRTAADSGGFRT
jgi:hypothetical protein